MGEYIKKNFKELKKYRKDIGKLLVFWTGAFLMYRYGPSFAQYIEEQLPTEEKMMKMLQEMEAQGAMGPMGSGGM